MNRDIVDEMDTGSHWFNDSQTLHDHRTMTIVRRNHRRNEKRPLILSLYSCQSTSHFRVADGQELSEPYWIFLVIHSTAYKHYIYRERFFNFSNLESGLYLDLCLGRI